MTTTRPSTVRRRVAQGVRRNLKRRYGMTLGAKPSTVLGNIAGYVPRSMTTLARYPGPFQEKKIVTFEYQNSLVAHTPGATAAQLPVSYNDCFDFDKTATGVFGNKQPLYYDSLLSASGPYKQYKVKSWICTFTVVNNAAANISVFALPATSATSEIDSVAEADNMPGVTRLYLTAAGGSKTIGTVTNKGTPFDAYSNYNNDANTNGGYNSSPAAGCFGGLYIASDGAVVNVSVAVHCEMVVELGLVDALVS